MNISRFSIIFIIIFLNLHSISADDSNDIYIFNTNANCTNINSPCSFNDPNNWINGTSPSNYSNVKILYDVSNFDIHYIVSNGSTVIGSLWMSGIIVFNNLTIVNATVEMYSNLTVNSGLLVTGGENSYFIVNDRAALSLYLSNSPISIGVLHAGIKSECYFETTQLNITNLESKGYITLTNTIAGLGSLSAATINKLSLINSQLYVGSDLTMTNYTEIYIYRKNMKSDQPAPIIASGTIDMGGFWLSIDIDSLDTSSDYNILESQSELINGTFVKQLLDSVSNAELDLSKPPRYLVMSFQKQKVPPSIIFLIVLFSLIFLVILVFLIYVLVKCFREKKRRSSYRSLN